MRFKLLLSTLVFLSACQTRLSFEGRRYTKGLYWNITSSPHTKKQKSNIQNTIVAPANFPNLLGWDSILFFTRHQSISNFDRFNYTRFSLHPLFNNKFCEAI